MVLSGSAKHARYQNSLVNRTNNCGGIKKAGLISRVGHHSSVYNTMQTRGVSAKEFVLKCPSNYGQGGRSQGGIGRMFKMSR